MALCNSPGYFTKRHKVQKPLELPGYFSKRARWLGTSGSNHTILLVGLGAGHVGFELPLLDHRQLFHVADFNNRYAKIFRDLSDNLIKAPTPEWKPARNVRKMA
jgi:hypothetical protein